MNRYMLFLTVVCLAVFALAACGPMSDGASSLPKEVKLTKDDGGKSVEVAKGGMLEVVLEGNPTTGYTWEVGTIDDKVLKLEGEPGFKADSNAVGAGGVMTLKFKAEGAGKTDLKLVYHQPWEKDQPPAETFEVAVTVK